MRNMHVSATKAVNKAVIALAFLAVLTDGFDTAILAMLVPHLAQDWETTAATFTYPLVLTNIGVVVGYLSCGAVAKHLGEKRLLVLGTAVFGVATILSAATLPLESMTLLSITRTVTGVGLGVVLPMAVIVGTQNGPEEKRQPLAVLVTMGLISGATVAGFTGGALIEGIGTSGVLWISGAFPLLVAALLQKFVPQTAAQVASTVPGAPRTGIGAIFAGEHRNATLLLWTATFLIFTVTYTLKSWLPTLFGEYGLSKLDAGLGLAYYSLGGVVAGLVVMLLSAKIGTARGLVLMSAIGATATVALATMPVGGVPLMVITLVAGAGITAGSIGQTAIAVSIYEASVRTTGVGWSAACGRMGSILGPTVGGILLALSWPAQDIVLLMAAPIVVTTLCWLVLPKLSNQVSKNDTPAPVSKDATTAPTGK
ncbi:MFS transporter [Paenarthrobacter sp. NPDC056912]|uniref:MFS transporter n=1 Tax=Paenarthrobacter sp. NPDC056912 TaxID=3345965 RepID=UPI00366E380F